jgi:hypothetical protein
MKTEEINAEMATLVQLSALEVTGNLSVDTYG